jgi:hypothetical protein
VGRKTVISVLILFSVCPYVAEKGRAQSKGERKRVGGASPTINNQAECLEPAKTGVFWLLWRANLFYGGREVPT